MSMSSSVIGIQSGSESFNTVNGKYCYNSNNRRKRDETRPRVSIPQAVSTVATFALLSIFKS